MVKVRVNFCNLLNAKKAEDALRKMGCKNAHLDMVRDFLEEYSEEINIAGSANAPSLSSLVMHSGSHSWYPDKAPLVAASPLVSGIGVFREIADGPAACLEANVDDDKISEVRNLLKELGGNL